VYFTETGFAHFVSDPAHELFNQSLSLTTIFDVYAIEQTAAQLSLATNDRQRIRIVEQFLLSQLHSPETDQLVAAAVRLIYQSKGAVRIKQLQEQLFISESPFEKRFRKIVGTSPKKFASIVRFEAAMDDLDHDQSLSAICYQHHFFDQAHFTKVFSQFTGATPEHFRRML
jgi:AraC-like DNA-binding protein